MNHDDDEMLTEGEMSSEAVMWLIGIQAVIYLFLIAFFAAGGGGAGA